MYHILHAQEEKVSVSFRELPYLTLLFPLSSKHKAERDQLEITTSTAEVESPTVKELKNPFYGYGVHAKDSDLTDSGYSVIQKRGNGVRQVDNPTYGMTEVRKEKEPVSNPMYGANIQPAVQLGSSTGSGLYTEVPVSREECVYEEENHL